MFSLGEGFVQTPVPDAEEKIAAGTSPTDPTAVSRQTPPRVVSDHCESILFLRFAASEQAQQELDNLKSQIKEVEGKMAELKKVLYAKFGESINLEE
jgi:hypothetical protein